MFTFSEADMTPPAITEPEDQGSSTGDPTTTDITNPADVDIDDDAEQVDVDDENDDLEEVDSAATALLQAHTALALINRLGRTPKYMRAVSQGTSIAACMESNNSALHVMSLESALSDGLGDMLRSFRYTLGRWKNRIHAGLILGIYATIGIKLATVKNNYLKFYNSLHSRYSNFSETNPLTRNMRIETVVIKRNRVCTIGVRRIPGKLFRGAITSVLQGNGFTDIGETTIDVRGRARRVLSNRLRQSQFKIWKWGIFAIILGTAGGALMKNTPNALFKAANERLPMDRDSYDDYCHYVANTITQNTAFGVAYHPDGAGDNVPEGRVDPEISSDPSKLGDYLKLRDDAFKRFAGVVDLLDKRMQEATAINNPYAIKAVTFLTSICKAVIDKCTEGGGALKSVLQKLDRFMDQFHEEANAMQK